MGAYSPREQALDVIQASEVMREIPALEPIAATVRMPDEELWSALADECAGRPGASARVAAALARLEREGEQ